MTPPSFRQIIWPMAFAETILWVTSYYLFPALLPVWEQEFGWSKAELSGALTLSLLISAILAPIAGKLIDHGHGPFVFAGSAVLLSLSLFGLAQVETVLHFYIAWAGIGLAMAGGLYEACFAIVTRCMGHDSKRAITIITLFAGFAGTICFPLTSALASQFDWRVTVFSYGVFVCLVAVPILWRTTKLAEKYPFAEMSDHELGHMNARGAIATLSFWCLGVSFLLLSLNHSMILTHLLPILADRKINAEAAILAASMIGPMQVAGRLAMMLAEKHAEILYIGLACCAGLLLASLSLFGVSAATGLIVGFVVLQGASIGITSILRPVMIGEWIGRRNFGVISGMLAVFYLAGHSIAPSVSAFVWEWGGYDKVLLLTAFFAGLCFVVTLAAWYFSPKRLRDANTEN